MAHFRAKLKEVRFINELINQPIKLVVFQSINFVRSLTRTPELLRQLAIMAISLYKYA